MGAKSRFGYFFASAVATQFLLGCQPGEKQEELTALPAVSVPAELEHPAELVGNWQEAKGKQTVQLNADGSGEFTFTATDWVTVPPVPVHEMIYVCDVVRFPVD